MWRHGSGRKILISRPLFSKSVSTSLWSNKSILPGGFNSNGLREWAVLNDFGSDGCVTQTSREMRRRRRQVIDDPYVDLFSKRVSDECSQYLSGHPSPSDALGRAFFGSRNFIAEKIALSSLDSLLSLYPEGATTLPKEFGLNNQYLQWKVTMKAPLELICSYQIERLNLRGCTMVAFDPALRRAYHGNCFDVAEKRIEGFFLKNGIHMHTKYAEFLLDGMVESLEKLADGKKE
jgi:hypothetical protein